MANSVERRAAAGITAGGGGFLLNMLIAFIQVPILLQYWHPGTYGAWIELQAATGMIVALDAGHQNYLGSEFNRLWVTDMSALRATLASGFWAAIAIAVLELAAGIAIVLSGRLQWLTGQAHKSMGHEDVAGAFILFLVFWAVCGSIGGIVVRLYPPAGLFARSQWLGVIGRMIAFIALVGVVSRRATIMEAMGALVAGSMLFNGYLFFEIRRRLPGIFPWWRGGTFALGWRNFKVSLVLTASGIMDQLGSNGLVLLVAGALNPMETAMFTTVRTIANVAIQGTAILLNPLAPDLARFYVKREGGKLTAVFSTSWFLGTSLMAAGLAIGPLFLEPLYLLWTRRALPLDRALFACLGAAMAIRQWSAPLQAFLVSLNRVRALSVISAARALFGVAVTAALLSRFGLVAAGLGGLAAEIAATAFAAYAIHLELDKLKTRFPFRSAGMAFMQLLVTGIVLYSFSAKTSAPMAFSAVGLIVISYLAWRQWHILSPEVKSRIAAVLPIGL